jgi:hypothetical protein
MHRPTPVSGVDGAGATGTVAGMSLLAFALRAFADSSAIRW